MTLLIHKRRRLLNVVAPPPTPPSSLVGVGGNSTSLIDYPDTVATTVGDWYVDGASGSDSNSGASLGQAFATIGKALSSLSDGQVVLVRGGTYSVSSTINRNTSWTTGVKIMGYGGEVPVIASSANIGLSLNGSLEKWVGFRIRGASLYGVRIQGGSNTLERIYVHDCATEQYGVGIIINSQVANDNLIQSCAVWRLGVPGQSGTNTPDGITFTAPSGTYNQRNMAVRCVVANATDDCFDLYRSRDSMFIDCVAIGGGYYYNGNTASSEGHGYKLGSGGGQGNDARGCIAVHNRRTGFNSNGASNTSYYNCSSYHNNYGIEFRGNGSSGYAENCITLWNGQNVPIDQYNTLPPSGSLVTNSWQLGISTGNINLGNPSGGDFSLASGSSALGVGTGGTNLGASTVALEVLDVWWNHSGIWIPGRGSGPGGTGLPGD